MQIATINDIDLFVWAYERSAGEYVLVRKSLAEPDPIRLRYRQELHELVADIVRNKRPDILQTIAQFAEKKHRRAESLRLCRNGPG